MLNGSDQRCVVEPGKKSSERKGEKILGISYSCGSYAGDVATNLSQGGPQKEATRV